MAVDTVGHHSADGATEQQRRPHGDTGERTRRGEPVCWLTTYAPRKDAIQRDRCHSQPLNHNVVKPGTAKTDLAPVGAAVPRRPSTAVTERWPSPPGFTFANTCCSTVASRDRRADRWRHAARAPFPERRHAARQPDVVSEVSDEDLTYRRRLLWVILLSVMGFGSLMTIVTVSLPTIADDLAASVVTLLWTVTGLMLAMAVVTPLVGKLGDIYGHRRVLLSGSGGPPSSASCAGWRGSHGALIVFRVLFGVSGARSCPAAMALVMRAYGPISRRATAMGWFQFAMTGAPTWARRRRAAHRGGRLAADVRPSPSCPRWRFAGGGRARLAPPERGATRLGGRRPLAAVTLAGLFSIVRRAARSHDGPADRHRSRAVGPRATAVGSLLLFVRIERRVANPLLRLSQFCRRNFTSPLVASAANQFAYMGGFVVAPLLLATSYG